MAQAAVAEEADAKPKGGVLKIIIFVVGAVILLVGGFAGGYLISQQSVSPSEEVMKLLEERLNAENAEDEFADAEKVAREMPAQEAFLTQYYQFPEPLTTNLRESRRFLQVGIGVSTQYDEQVILNVETHTLALRSDMLAVISGFTESDVAGLEGREALADALRDAINKRLEELEGFGGVEDVFFATFVMQ